MRDHPQGFALVAGASSGIGFEVTQYLLDEGYFVFGLSRSEMAFRNPLFFNLEVDLREEDSIVLIDETLREATLEIGDIDDFEGLDLIVNCSGVFDMLSIDEMDTELFTDHLLTNTVGAFHLLKATRSFLIEQESHYIHLSSLVASKGYPHLSAYGASKAALERLIETCREEWREEKIRFSLLIPSAVDTPLWDDLTQGGELISRNEMLSLNDFLHVFEMVMKSPHHLHFPSIVFAHRDAVLGQSLL